jgi:hypothetical protein
MSELIIYGGTAGHTGENDGVARDLHPAVRQPASPSFQSVSMRLASSLLLLDYIIMPNLIIIF